MSRNAAASGKPVWIALTIALVFHIGLISLQGRNRLDSSFVRVWVLDLLAPIEKVADRGLHGLGYVWSRYVGFIGVYDENQRLKRENDELRLQLELQKEAVLEAQRVRTLAGLQESGIRKSVIARVIGRDPARSQTITVDKGTKHGVKPDTAVITPHGIVGRVIHSSNSFSIVQLIVDSQAAVGAMLQSTRRRGILKGNGRDLELDYIDDDNDLKEGDTFLTSGEDRIYPKGLSIGLIMSVGARQGLFRAVQIQPSADLGRLEEVICITELQEPLGSPELAQPLPNP
jgi:rod shape-determining protein MreC